MTKAQIRKNAFLKSIPIMCSYIFVSMAYGIMMENAGFGWYYSLFVSLAFPNGVNQLVQDAIRNQQSRQYDQCSGESPG